MEMFKLAILSTFSIVFLSSLSGGVYGSSENSFLPSALNSRDFSGLKRLVPNGPNPAQPPEQGLSSDSSPRRNSGVRKLLLTKEASASTVNEWSSNHFQHLKSSDVVVTWDVPSGPNPIQNKSPPPVESSELVDPTGRYPPSGPNPGEPPAAVYSSHLKSSDVGVTWDVPSGPNPIQNKSPPPAESSELVDPTGRYPPSGPNPGEPPAAVYSSHLKSGDVGVTWDVPSGPNPIQNKSPPPVESSELVDPTGRYPPSGPNPDEPPAAVYSSHLKSGDVGVTWDVPSGPNPIQNKSPPPAESSELVDPTGRYPPSGPNPGEPPAADYSSHLKSSDVGVTWDVPSGPNPIQNKSPPPAESSELVDPTGRYPPSGPNPGEPPVAVYSSHLKSSQVGVSWNVPSGPNPRQPPVAVQSSHFVITGKGQVPPSAPSPHINPTVPVESSHSKDIAIPKKGQVPPSAPSPHINPTVPVEWSHSKDIAITKKGQVPPSAPSPDINLPVGPN